MVIIILLTLNIGIALGWYAERLLRMVVALHERKPVVPGVVKTTIAPGARPNSSSVVRARTPKEVAADQERKFNDEFQI